MRHIVTDTTTGKIIRNEEMPSDVDPKAFLRQAMHDCPECRAAFERGEVPVEISGEELHERLEAMDPELRAFMKDLRRTPIGMQRRPRWRDLKRRVRRAG